MLHTDVYSMYFPQLWSTKHVGVSSAQRPREGKAHASAGNSIGRVAGLGSTSAGNSIGRVAGLGSALGALRPFSRCMFCCSARSFGHSFYFRPLRILLPSTVQIFTLHNYFARARPLVSLPSRLAAPSPLFSRTHAEVSRRLVPVTVRID